MVLTNNYQKEIFSSLFKNFFPNINNFKIIINYITESNYLNVHYQFWKSIKLFQEDDQVIQ